MSSDLQWLLLRKWNSFQHKGGNGPIFSKEPVCCDFHLLDYALAQNMAGCEATILARSGDLAGRGESVVFAIRPALAGKRSEGKGSERARREYKDVADRVLEGSCSLAWPCFTS